MCSKTRQTHPFASPDEPHSSLAVLFQSWPSASMNCDQAPQVDHGERRLGLHSNSPSTTEKSSNSIFLSERESPFWQEAWRIPKGEIFQRFKDTPGMSCHSSFFHFDLHYTVVRCGFRYLCFSSSKKKSSTSEDRERCDRQVHKSVQVTIEKMSSHKYPRCQNSNKPISSLIS